MKQRVFTNGFKKTGNHALVKACELLGCPPAGLGVYHLPYGELPAAFVPTHKIVIKRDPRNVIVSLLRYDDRSVTPGTFLSTFRNLFDVGLVEAMGTFAGWLTDPGTMVVSFEKLIADPAEIRRIAEFLGVKYVSGAFEDLPGHTPTWTGRYSDYRDVWTPEVARAWQDEGGNDLMRQWGYEPAVIVSPVRWGL